MNIFIAAHYNLNNGDRALLEATVGIFKKNYPDGNITVSAYKPEKFKDDRCSVVNWPLSSGVKEKVLLKLSHFKAFRKLFWHTYGFVCNSRYVEQIKKADVVFISGGHHLTDILSDSNYYRLASNFVVPIALKKSIVMLPQSIGPARSKNVRESIAKLLDNVNSIAYRDNSSLAFLDSLGKKINTCYVPDIVYDINPRRKESGASKIVGVALYHAYVKKNRQDVLPYTIKNLTKVIDRLLSEGYGVKIIWMDEGDDTVADEIYRNLSSDKKKQNYSVTEQNDDILALIEEFSGLEFVIAYKTHATIFSMICNTPLIAVSYHPKTLEFMESVGLSEYAIRDVDASYEKIWPLIEKVKCNRDRICKLEQKGVEHNREIIESYISEIKKCFC